MIVFSPSSHRNPQAHGDKCTESFYKDQVEDELRSQRAVGDERRHLEKIVAALNCLDGDVGLEDGDDAVDEEDAEEERLAQLLERAEAGELRIEDPPEAVEWQRAVVGQRVPFGG